MEQSDFQKLKVGTIRMDYLVSVIIPCFNTGVFLPEALQSVFDSGFENYEVIVVNDGSVDETTLEILASIDFPKVKVIHQENKGLGAARNFGVRNSIGELLFFLDSDNRVRKGYFENALESFKADSSLGVVYSRPVFFGESDEIRFIAKPYNFNALLAGNYIDACAFVRRSTFQEVGGFDEDRRLKISEDWDLWVRVGLTDWKFHFIDKPLFDYRIRKNSMIGSSDLGNKEITLQYLGEKYGYLIHQKYRQHFRVLEMIQKKPFSYFLRILYYKYILKKPLIK